MIWGIKSCFTSVYKSDNHKLIIILSCRENHNLVLYGILYISLCLFMIIICFIIFEPTSSLMHKLPQKYTFWKFFLQMTYAYCVYTAHTVYFQKLTSQSGNRSPAVCLLAARVQESLKTIVMGIAQQQQKTKFQSAVQAFSYIIPFHVTALSK